MQTAVHDLLTTNVQVEDLYPSYTGPTAMAIVPLPLPPAVEARALLHHLLEHGDVVGRDTVGRTIIQLAVDDWALEKPLTFDAEAAELEDERDGEPDDEAEEDAAPAVLLECELELLDATTTASSRARSAALTSIPYARTHPAVAHDRRQWEVFVRDEPQVTGTFPFHRRDAASRFRS